MSKEATSTDEVSANLEAALAGTSAESSAAEETEKTTETQEATTTEEGKGENQIPQSRFNEVIAARNEATAKAEELESQLAETNRALASMTELLEEKDADSQLLNQIKSYVNDPDMKGHIEAIDAKLRGVELDVQEQVEKGEITPEQALVKQRELVEQVRAETQEALADQQADALLQRADIIADKLLDSLPEDYTEQDINVIKEIWPGMVDWDAAAADPDSLQSELSSSFQEAIEVFGEPRGGLISEEAKTEETEVTPTPTPEEELASLMDKPWSTAKEGKAELSDAEFAADMAKAMRLARDN